MDIWYSDTYCTVDVGKLDLSEIWKLGSLDLNTKSHILGDLTASPDRFMYMYYKIHILNGLI